VESHGAQLTRWIVIYSYEVFRPAKAHDRVHDHCHDRVLLDRCGGVLMERMTLYLLSALRGADRGSVINVSTVIAPVHNPLLYFPSRIDCYQTNGGGGALLKTNEDSNCIRLPRPSPFRVRQLSYYFFSVASSLSSTGPTVCVFRGFDSKVHTHSLCVWGHHRVVAKHVIHQDVLSRST
jgi:hypothetical protein